MSVEILTTKLYMPPARANAIAREQLVERLLAAASQPGGFSLVSGPAGFGKTTLLSAFVTRLQQPAAWLSLDENDNNPVRFWTYLIAACQTILGEFAQPAWELLRTPQALPDETIPTILINDLITQDRPLILILDDYHAIQNPSIHAGLLFLLDHLPRNLHLVISTRIDPPWPLARFRARNQLAEIRTRDLRFNLDETADFLTHTMGLELSVENIASLAARTEGWAAGLQLAALSMQGHHDIPTFVEAFTGSHLYVAEYLLEEVLQRQSDEIRTFLLRTSILKRLQADLCVAVAGCRDGQAFLQYLLEANIFIVALDQEGRWFRYHHLFADLLQARLRQELPAEAIDSLHQRASSWYEQQGYTHEAIQHALAAQDFDRVAGLVEGAAHDLLFRGQVSQLREWLEALPREVFETHPRLAFYLFWVDVLQNQADLSAGALQEIEARLNDLSASPDNDRLRGEMMAVVCRAIALAGHTSQGIRLAQAALANLPDEALAARARASSALAIAHDLEGRAAEAEPIYQESLFLAMAAGDYRLAAHTLFAKGLVQTHYGQLHLAASTFQAIIDLPEREESILVGAGEEVPGLGARTKPVFFPAGQGYIGLARLHLEWNNLEKAARYLEQGLDLCRRGGLDGIFTGRVQLSRLCQAQGDLEGALAAIQLPEHAGERVDDFNLATRQIEIGLARGDVETAWRWAEPFATLFSNDQAASRMPLVFLESLQAVLARVYLARGEIGKACVLLDGLQATAEPGRRLGRLVEVYLLRARAYQEQNGGEDTSPASESLARALELGEPQGYVTLFLEEGPALVPLLQALQRGRVASERVKTYASQLLEAFDRAGMTTAGSSPVTAAGLVEPLTPREVEVLALLAAGDANQTIAEKLFITVRTVKKHTSNIYGKLDVNSRTQAVARARQLGLLPAD